MTRHAFQQAAGFFLQAVEQIPEDCWDAPGLGVWTVRDLVGHTCRAITTVETYSAQPAGRVELARPVDYMMRAMETWAEPGAVAERGRRAGRELGEKPALTVRETAERVLARLDQMPDSAILGVPVGGMRLIDYLPTRVFELTIHTLDIAAAIGRDVEPPQSAMKMTLYLLADRALRLGQGPALALATTGRQPLPEGFTLLG